MVSAYPSVCNVEAKEDNDIRILSDLFRRRALCRQSHLGKRRYLTRPPRRNGAGIFAA
jgi:hypothetical protein